MTHPLPEPDTHCWDDDTKKDVWSYSAEQMHAYAATARQQALEDAATMLDAEHVARKGADNHAAYYALKVRAMMEKP